MSDADDNSRVSVPGSVPVGAATGTSPLTQPPFHILRRIPNLPSLGQVVQYHWDDGFVGRSYARANPKYFIRTEQESEVSPDGPRVGTRLSRRLSHPMRRGSDQRGYCGEGIPVLPLEVAEVAVLPAHCSSEHAPVVLRIRHPPDLDLRASRLFVARYI